MSETKAITRTQWPNPAEPGVPLNPDQSGWHWLRYLSGGLAPWHWDADQGGPGLGGWDEEGGDGAPASFDRAFTYLAPCIPPITDAKSV